MSECHGSAPWRLETHDSLPSTSDLCIARARAGEPEGLAVRAVAQTAGRGSRGRSWFSPAGNLHLSVLLRPDEAAARAGMWSLLAAVALRDALGSGLTLKWPNDVLRDGRKLGGILLDSTVAAGRLEWLVIGFGANLATAPAGAAEVAADPAAAAAAVLEAIDRYRRAGPAAVRAAWLAAAHPPGTPLRFAHGGAVFEGEFAGLGEDGALALWTAAGLKTFATGEVSHGAPA